MKKNNEHFDSTLSKHAYKAKAKFVWVMRGVLSDINYFYNLWAGLLMTCGYVVGFYLAAENLRSDYRVQPFWGF